MTILERPVLQRSSEIDLDEDEILSVGYVLLRRLFPGPVHFILWIKYFRKFAVSISTTGSGVLLLDTFNHASYFPVGTNPHQLI